MSDAIIADLHSHTTASDGELSPEELVRKAAEAGLQALSVTDHDSVAGVERAADEGRKIGLEIVPGCELTIYENEMELHLLALFVDITPGGPFRNLLKRLQDYRRERACQIAAKLRAAGFEIADDDIFEAARGAESVGRPHIAAANVKRGHAPSIFKALVEFLHEGRVGYVPKFKLRPEETFEAVKASGGLSLMAHPGRTQHDELIAPLFRRGMDGVEALYRSHGVPSRRFYCGLARRYEKLVSGGSDYHGPRLTPHIRLGEAGVSRQVLSDLKNAAKKRTSPSAPSLSGR